MKNVKEMEYHETSEKLVEVIKNRLQRDDPHFTRLMVAYHFAVMAASMRTMIRMPEGNCIPVNMYALNLAPSAYGKSQAERILTSEVMGTFISRFIDETFPVLAEDNFPKLALKRAGRKGTDPDQELEAVRTEFKGTGPFTFSFDSGSAPAIKQARHKLLMAQAGSLNCVIDEVGLNFQKNQELLEIFMELYDGETKSKLTKATKESVRLEEIAGKTAANLMMFGTANKMLGELEDVLFELIESGYGRRLFYGHVKEDKRRVLTAKEQYEMAKSAASDPLVNDLDIKFGRLSDPINANKVLVMPEATALAMFTYKADCEKRALSLSSQEDLLRTELVTRFFKAVKLAGAYAFIDESPEITVEHLEAAIKVAEDSGEEYRGMLYREQAHMKLARYISEIKEPLTHSDLIQNLKYVPAAQSKRHEMLTLATAWGYKNNIIIKKSFIDGVELLSGESLQETDLDKIVVSYSDDIATGYTNEYAPFDQLHRLTQAQGMHWVNHHFKAGNRRDEEAIEGFNTVVIDVDGGVALNTAKLLLKDYKALYYTTKRSTPTEERFRIVLPLNYTLKMDSKEYKEFMDNVYAWLPFEVDDGTGQRNRKWLSHNGHHEYTDGQLLDVLPFIPKTSKNAEHKKFINDTQSLNNLERWVMNHTGDGNRNNMLLKYALILVDSGFGYNDVQTKVIDLNDKLPDKLKEAEIVGTIMSTVGKRINNAA